MLARTVKTNENVFFTSYHVCELENAGTNAIDAFVRQKELAKLAR